MINRTAEDDMAYYKGKILGLIIGSPGKYSLRDIENRFGLNSNKIEQFILEYNKAGFEIYMRKGRYIAKSFRGSGEVFLQTAKRQESELHSLYESLIEKSLFAKEISMDTFINGLNDSSDNKSSIIKKLYYLERDGLIFYKNNQINILEPSFTGLDDGKVLKLLIFINIVRNFYPKPNLLNGIFLKLLLEYGNRGFRFNPDAIQHTGKCKMSLYEEIILNMVEDAIYYDKSLEFSYMTQVGTIKIKINPSGIIFNSQKDMWYVVTLGERRTEYRMDKMTNVRIVDGGAGQFARNLYEYSMGISGENLTDVKAAFRKEDYIYKKLLNYIKIRRSAGIKETNNAYILTDRVCGTNEFKKWLRTFGEDAVCLKPNKLREEIFKDIKLLWERYGVI